MKWRFILGFLMFLFSSPARAKTDMIAVLEANGIGIDKNLLSLISDEIRGGTLKGLNKKRYTVMTRESILEILRDMGLDASCFNGQCEVEIGRNIGADYVISSNIGKIQKTYILTVKIHNTKQAKLVATNRIQNEDPVRLLDDIIPLTQRILLESELITAKDKKDQESNPNDIKPRTQNTSSSLKITYDNITSNCRTEEGIKKIIARNHYHFDNCYKTWQNKRSYPLEGQIVYSFYIHKDGYTSSRSIKDSTFADRDFEKCILGSFEAVKEFSIGSCSTSSYIKLLLQTQKK